MIWNPELILIRNNHIWNFQWWIINTMKYKNNAFNSFGTIIHAWNFFMPQRIFERTFDYESMNIIYYHHSDILSIRWPSSNTWQLSSASWEPSRNRTGKSRLPVTQSPRLSVTVPDRFRIERKHRAGGVLQVCIKPVRTGWFSSVEPHRTPAWISFSFLEICPPWTVWLFVRLHSSFCYLRRLDGRFVEETCWTIRWTVLTVWSLIFSILDRCFIGFRITKLGRSWRTGTRAGTEIRRNWEIMRRVISFFRRSSKKMAWKRSPLDGLGVLCLIWLVLTSVSDFYMFTFIDIVCPR